MSVWIVYKSVSKKGSFRTDDPRPVKGSTQDDRFLSATSAEIWYDQAPPSLGQESLKKWLIISKNGEKLGTYCELGVIDRR